MTIQKITSTINQLALMIDPTKSNLVETIGLIDYLTNYRTIGLNLPRQTGKTTFMVSKFVCEHALLVVPNQSLKQDVVRRHPRLGSYVITASEGSGIRYFGIGQRIQPFEYILFDEPGIYPKHFDMVDFLSNLSYNRLVDANTTIIKLGTA
jgi:hypothetical protein